MNCMNCWLKALVLSFKQEFPKLASCPKFPVGVTFAAFA